MAGAVAAMSLAGRRLGWTVRFDDGASPFRVTREEHGFEFVSDSDRFRLAHRDGSWRSPDGPGIRIRSKPAGDYLRRIWTIEVGDVTLRASERGSGRPAVRRLGEVVSTSPFHFVVPTVVEMNRDDGTRAGAIRSRRTFPISFVASCDDLDARGLAAVAVIVGFGTVA